MGFLSSIGVDVSAFKRGVRGDGFLAGCIYGDGDVQRHILGIHRDFADSWRLCGDFACVLLPPARIDPSSYSIETDTVDEYASRIRNGSVPPPVVLDYDGDFIDGGHRHAAALAAGAGEMLALVQIADIQEDPDEEN